MKQKFVNGTQNGSIFYVKKFRKGTVFVKHKFVNGTQYGSNFYRIEFCEESVFMK